MSWLYLAEASAEATIMKDFNTKNLGNISYMLRHLLTFNITDPLSNASREYTDDFTQYFSGTGEADQVMYLERRPTTSGRFRCWLSGVEKVAGTDFTLSRNNGTITWDKGTDPADSDDNIKIEYQAYKQWIFDDRPSFTSRNFPRISVIPEDSEYTAPGMGIYNNYTSGIGDRVVYPFTIEIRNRQNNEYYTYDSIHYKNMELVDAIAEDIILYLNSNKNPMPWKFFWWSIKNSSRNNEDENFGIYRRDISIEIEVFHQS
uniref:Uncharacterized protein n=1 Tax=viral metagenome TaxID=1070528 RepID=A0A6M3M1K8_9ZZZZ